MKHVTRLSSKGQVVLPAAVRRELGLTTGDQLVVETGAAGDRRIVLRPAGSDELDAQLARGYRWLAGLGDDLVETLHASRRQARARERRRP